MLLQAWYGLSDPELESQCHDRLSFRNFLGFPDRIPNFTTIWKIRDRLKESGVDKKIWDEQQLNVKGYRVKKRVIRDASFIEADLGKKRYQQEKRAWHRGESVEYAEKPVVAY
jgi:IS5 family transposase